MSSLEACSRSSSMFPARHLGFSLAGVDASVDQEAEVSMFRRLLTNGPGCVPGKVCEAAMLAQSSSMRPTRSLKRFCPCMTLCLKDAKSRAFTEVPGRSRQMQSRSVRKLRVGVCPSSAGWKRQSTYMSKCFSCTSSSCNAFMTFSSRFILKNSSRLMLPLLSLSICIKIVVMASLTPSSLILLFSPSAVLSTTSTRIPTSIFITVNELISMYKMNAPNIHIF
mmetsp:Transcript_37754/g.87695  ORF Transcript_37754/g.87695 Transcript_37754/m.87695 type:complete len:223 (+) Transcript_37754:184-852(+)